MDWTFDFQVNHDLCVTAEALAARSRQAFSTVDVARVDRALVISDRAHLGQVRGDGSPYITHPIRTALLTLQYEPVSTADVIVACLLHDALEDTSLSEQDVTTEFGHTVSRYVLAVTRYRPAKESPKERFEGKLIKWKQIMSACHDIRVIKTFDYCDNVISWKFIKPEMPAYKKIPRWLKEAKELYLPLAETTNGEAALLIANEIETYRSAGHNVGDWLQG